MFCFYVDAAHTRPPVVHNLKDRKVVTDIFQEVEEDVRREELQKYWRRYGAYVVGLALLLVVAVGGTEAYRYFSGQKAKEHARAFIAAADALREDPKSAVDAFAALAAKGGGYGLLADFRLAQIKSQTGDAAGALAIYDKIAKETRADDPMHGLAIVKSGYLSLDSASLAGLEDRLLPLASGDGPWRHSALEILAFAALKAGDTAKARTRFDALAKDGTAPTGMVRRAHDMASALPPVAPTDTDAATPAPAAPPQP